jgi:hypothetical protein
MDKKHPLGALREKRVGKREGRKKGMWVGSELTLDELPWQHISCYSVSGLAETYPLTTTPLLCWKDLG